MSEIKVGSPVLALEQLHILQHTLGADEYGIRRGDRNYFCAGVRDEVICRELVALGYMQQHRTTDVYPYFNCSVTDAGKAAMTAESPKPPKLTRSQIRYRRFLQADTGTSFREWLRWEKQRKEMGERPIRTFEDAVGL